MQQGKIAEHWFANVYIYIYTSSLQRTIRALSFRSRVLLRRADIVVTALYLAPPSFTRHVVRCYDPEQ